MKKHYTRLMLFWAILALLFSMAACQNENFGVHIVPQMDAPEITSYPEASDSVLVYPMGHGQTEVYYTDGGNVVLYMALLYPYDNEEEKEDILNNFNTLVRDYPEYVEKIFSFDGYVGILFGWQYCKQLTVKQIVQSHASQPPTPQPDRYKGIKILGNLQDYSQSPDDYDTLAVSYDSGIYDGKNCNEQATKLKKWIDKVTEKVYFGKTESAIIKIFSKSTPDGILKAIADAALPYEEMVRIVDYIAGDKTADIDSYVKEIREEVNGKEVTTGWTGELTTTSSGLTPWKDAGENNKDLNEGWSLADDLELYKRLKTYSESKGVNGLTDSKNIVEKADDIGTRAVSKDNAWWQLRSIAEKCFMEINLDGSSFARLVTHLLLYVIRISEEMSNGSIKNAAADTNGTGVFSAYFKNKVNIARNIPTNLDEAKNYWDPYEGLGDYDTLVYLLAFNEFYTKGHKSLKGNQLCVKLFGYFYQYVKNVYQVVLSDKSVFQKQLFYCKQNVFNDDAWLDFVTWGRKVYECGLRYSENQYYELLTYYLEFQSKKESCEKTVYGIDDAIKGRTSIGEIQKAIPKDRNGIKGLLAIVDGLWTFTGSENDMKSLNKANTGYQKGKQSNNKEREYEGRFYYEFEKIKMLLSVLQYMSGSEFSGIMHLLCYVYSSSMINQMQDYSKAIVLITDGIKNYSDYTTVPDDAGIKTADKATYAINKLTILREQVKKEWTKTDVDTKASRAFSQGWMNGILDDLKDAKEYQYLHVKSDDTKKGDWQVRCECLKDRVVARIYSCCGQRISEADLSKCAYNHTQNKDGTAVTKEYDTHQYTSRFVKYYESIFQRLTARSQVEFQKPNQGYKTEGNEAVYNVGYYGDIPDLIEEVKTGSNVQKMTYKELKTFTMKSGASFEDEIASDKGEDEKWWNTNKPGSTLEGKQTGFGPETNSEIKSGSTLFYVYTYEFAGWFLDEACQFEFNPEDKVDFNLKIYAGYKLTKAQAQ